MKKTLFLIGLLLIILVLAAQLDDDLSVEAKQLISRLEAPAESEAYIYLIGINAGADDAPEKVGSKLLEEYRKYELDESYEIKSHQDSDMLSLPDGELFCRSWEEGCLETLFTTQIDAEKLNEENAILIARTNKFHDFNEYRTLTKPSIGEQFPPFQYISLTERIKVMNAISVYQQGSPDEAIIRLTRQFEKGRKALELQDNLIGKFVYLMRLSEIIDVASIIMSGSKNEIDVDYIPALSLTERNFDMVSAREFGMSFYAFKTLDKNPEFFQTGGDFPGWIIRMIYKPNMSINAIVPKYLRLQQLARVTPAEFVKKVQVVSEEVPATSKLRNYVGNVLTEIAGPNFDEYVARFMDFDAKLTLFNQRYHFKNDFSEVENPYYKGEAPEVSENRVCFRGPMKDDRFLRCMRTRI